MPGALNPLAKLNNAQVLRVYQLFAQGYLQDEIVRDQKLRQTGISTKLISDILRGVSYQNVKPPSKWKPRIIVRDGRKRALPPLRESLAGSGEGSRDK